MSKFPNIEDKPYIIQDELGHGGFATMYKAKDTKRNKPCVIKCLSLGKVHDWKSIELFEREAKILKNLDHPNIPDFIDYFTLETEKETQFLLVQEYVSGKSLKQWIGDGKRFTEQDVLKIGHAIAGVLDYLHGFSPPIIHRDIKPGNIMCKADGNAHLVDFGAVKDHLINQNKAEAATVIGTFGYMPMEQFEGHAVPASDIYALGMSLIYILSHREPTELEKRNFKINFRPYVNVSGAFASLLEDMIEPNVDKRIQSASLLKQRFEQLLTGKPLQAHITQPMSTKSIVLFWLIFIGLITTGGIYWVLSSAAPDRSTSAVSSLTSAQESIELGTAAYKRESYDEAVRHFTDAIQLDPNRSQAYYERGSTLLTQGKYKEAIRDFDDAVRLDSTYALAFNDRGVSYERLGQTKEALVDYSQAVQLQPKNDLFVRNWAQIYNELGQYDEAEKEFTRLITFDYSYNLHQDYNGRGISYLNQKKYEQAIQDFEKAIELKKDYKLPHYNLGEIALEQKKYSESIEHYTRALVIDPNYVSAYNERGLALFDLGEYDNAEQDYLKTIELDPQYTVGYNNLGYLYEVKKDYNKAIEYYNQALNVSPQYVTALYNRANSYKLLNQCAKAKQDYQTLCNLKENSACSETCP